MPTTEDLCQNQKEETDSGEMLDLVINSSVPRNFTP